MGERDDRLGLGLGLSLGCVGGGGGNGGREKKQQQFTLKLNEMPFPSNNHFTQINTTRKTSWNDLFQCPPDGSASTRPFWKGLDMNRVPPVMECEVDETPRVSSPNSTVSSLSGKRSEREPISDEAEANADAEAERASCSRVSDEEDGGDASRKKLRLSKEQSLLLEETFKEHNTLNPKQKLALAKQLNLRPRQVEVWFQNRRARTKLKQTEVDCEYLKRCCENLTEENRRLQKEVQELRALKLSPQLYMHMNPPTTLTMCPSCERVAVSSSSAASASAAASTSTLAPTGQSHLPVGGPNRQGPAAINPWAAMPVPQRPSNASTSRS